MERLAEQNGNQRGNQFGRPNSPPAGQINTTHKIIEKEGATNAPARQARNWNYNSSNSKKKLTF